MGKTKKPELMKQESEFLAEIKLEVPFTAFDKEIEVLQISFPTTELMRKLEDPFRLIDGGAQPLNDICAKYIEKLCNLPHKGANLISPKDFNAAKWALISFFSDFEMPQGME